MSKNESFLDTWTKIFSKKMDEMRGKNAGQGWKPTVSGAQAKPENEAEYAPLSAQPTQRWDNEPRVAQPRPKAQATQRWDNEPRIAQPRPQPTQRWDNVDKVMQIRPKAQAIQRWDNEPRVKAQPVQRWNNEDIKPRKRPGIGQEEWYNKSKTQGETGQNLYKPNEERRGSFYTRPKTQATQRWDNEPKIAQPRPKTQAAQNWENWKRPKTNIQRIASSILDNDEDVRDDFTRTLEGGNWKDAFLKARTNDFKKGADAYVSDIFAGKAQPSDGLTGGAKPGDAFDYTDGDLADEFTQGLFGEEYLRKRFVDKELSKFKPMLEEKASTLEKRIKQKNAGDSLQNAQSTVYNDSKGGASHVSNSTFDDKDAWWNKKWGTTPQAGAKTGGVDWSQMWNAAPQYEVAGKNERLKSKKYDEAPDELKRVYDILGQGDTAQGISLEGIEKEFGQEMTFQMDDAGNVIGDYRNAIEQKIDEQYKYLNEKDRKDALDATLLLFKAEFPKQIADPDKIIDVTDIYGKMITNSKDNPVWQLEMTGFGGAKGTYYFKNSPERIRDITNGQIPSPIINEAIKIGGENGVRYLQEQGYGFLRVGDKIMSPEELGNYSLGILATSQGHSRNSGYIAADLDKVKMDGTDAGEIYDKYYQTMGMEDANKTW